MIQHSTIFNELQDFDLTANLLFFILIIFRLASCFTISNAATTTAPDDEVKLVPVHKDDFKKINEFSEAAWIYRDPDNSDNITEIRRNLLYREVVYSTVSFCAIYL